MEEMNLSIADRICGELEEKNRVLSEYVKDKEEIGDKEGVIQVRIHQLALCKVLVTVHNRSSFILVQAHCNLGECYLNYEYFEQALEHLTVSLKLNGSLFTTVEDSKAYHPHILTLLGKCYIQAGGIDDGLNLLEKALKMNQSIAGEDNVSNTYIYSVLAEGYNKKKEYQKAIDSLTSMWELYEAQYGMKHEAIAKVYLEMAKIYHKQKDLTNALDLQKRALTLLMELDQQPDLTAEVAVKQAQWLQENNNYPEALDCLRNAEHLYEFNHGLIDKKTAKVKKNICTLLLKAGEYEEALEEFLELEEMEKGLHGEGSLVYAKNLKIIATILMILNRYPQAFDYYSRALNIFKTLRNSKKFIKEIKEKMTSISQTLKSNPELARGSPQKDLPARSQISNEEREKLTNELKADEDEA